ncbi:hypothetical protein [Nostoc sp.]
MRSIINITIKKEYDRYGKSGSNHYTGTKNDHRTVETYRQS